MAKYTLFVGIRAAFIDPPPILILVRLVMETSVPIFGYPAFFHIHRSIKVYQNSSPTLRHVLTSLKPFICTRVLEEYCSPLISTKHNLNIIFKQTLHRLDLYVIEHMVHFCYISYITLVTGCNYLYTTLSTCTTHSTSYLARAS